MLMDIKGVFNSHFINNCVMLSKRTVLGGKLTNQSHLYLILLVKKL